MAVGSLSVRGDILLIVAGNMEYRLSCVSFIIHPFLVIHIHINAPINSLAINRLRAKSSLVKWSFSPHYTPYLLDYLPTYLS